MKTQSSFQFLPVNESKPEPESEVRSLEQVLRAGDATDNYIVENLLRRGDQLVLAGPPKSGKSFLASELALAIARPFSEKEQSRLIWAGKDSNPKTHPFRINKKPDCDVSGFKVLFFSLEMAEGEVARRLCLQSKKLPPPLKRHPGKEELPAELSAQLSNIRLDHVFYLLNENGEKEQDLSILDLKWTPSVRQVERFL